MTRERWRIGLWALLLVIVLYLVWSAKAALLPFILGAILAYTLTPVVDRIASIIPARSERGDTIRRGFAVLAIYAVIAGGLIWGGSVLIPIATDQVAQFIETLPDNVEEVRVRASDWLDQYRDRVPDDVQERIDGYAEDLGNTAADVVSGWATSSVLFLTDTIDVIFGFLIVPFWLFYAMRDRHRVSRNFNAALPSAIAPDTHNILAIADRLLGRYLRAQLLLGLIVGSSVGVALTLLDVPLSLALGIFAGITELIPIIGPWLGAIPGVIIVAAVEPDLLLPVIAVYFIVQQLENNLLVPRIQGQAVDIHPAMVILLLAVAGAVFGFWGLVAAVPATAILRELFWYADRRLSGQSPAAAMAATHVSRAEDYARLAAQHLAKDAARAGTLPAPQAQGEVARPPASQADKHAISDDVSDERSGQDAPPVKA